ncbi:hypothetical protein [Corynebacterium meridianum]|uniref:Uncharacterized protein n=1 Tax=Corynebacterium meridianum TaxID=2765363 RepID=A0A934HZK4_9CORY|nr:hypothetical protein [Corynebacterium meridianum]MBI8989472.1 hypothetical protein [Corynebacterium meridianum]MCK7677452.1 hypothetical protein [Corynebacterium meridianum]
MHTTIPDSHITRRSGTAASPASSEVSGARKEFLRTWGLWFVLAGLAVLTVGAWSLLAEHRIPQTMSAVLAVGILVVAGAGAVWLTGRGGRGRTSLVQLASVLSPTILLMTVFPTITDTLLRTAVGQTTTMTVVLAVSVTVPWLSGGVCMPVYEPLSGVARGPEGIRSEERTRFYGEFCSVWPSLVVWILPPLAAATLVINIFFGWGAQETAIYALGVFTNMLFAQSLIPLQETRRFRAMIAAWGCYAGFLFIAPGLWWLAPVVGVIPPAAILGRGLLRVFTPTRLPGRATGTALILGLLYACVLWSDKFLIVGHLYPEGIDIYVVYVALVPMVVATGVYFAGQYEVLREALDDMRTLVDVVPARHLQENLRQVARRVENTVIVTVGVAAAVGLGMMFAFRWFGFVYSFELLALTISPLAMLTLMLVTFQMAQLQSHWLAGGLCAVHLVAAVPLISLVPLAPALLVLAVIDVAAAMWGGRECRRVVSDASFELFWKQAVEW